MRLFGLTLSREKAAVSAVPAANGGGWFGAVRESFAGAWQQNVEVRRDSVLQHPVVHSCMTLIASDISKMRMRLVSLDGDGIWNETQNTAFSPVLRKPNRFQNRIQFYEHWVLSKLSNGNTYVLKVRDGRGVVTALYVLDPNRVTPLVAPDGSVYYRLSTDNLAGIATSDVVAPAREIIHDRMSTIFHPLVGVSPLVAAGLAATQGLNIQNHSARFFSNGARPGGILTAPDTIPEAVVARLKETWQQNFTGDNAGKVAVLGNGLTYQGLTTDAVDSEIIDQLKWTAEIICSCLHMPAYMVGVGAPPPYNNIEALNQQYYSQCLQILIESIELCLDEGLELPAPYGTEFDTDDLLRMDTATMVKAEAEAVGAGIKGPNESRRRLNLRPVEGGDTPYLQQQNFSLSALSKRDQDNPFAKPAPVAAPAAANDDTAQAMSDQGRKAMDAVRKGFADVRW